MGLFMNKEDILFLILMPLFLLGVSKSPAIKPLDGKCFPDYRPGFGCLVFEKLP